ncbi:hypothetical protein COM45_00190 [Corynebacterium accolens]|uniref:Uncharacterized protein n=1 Tax=Corynebacterium accolens TaxID=38284 RepID=A0A2A4ANZ6_9CORY|nr:hypothetical protein COM45_00190 [Corynebacterium accolens]
MLSRSSFGLLVLRVSLHDIRDFCMRLMMRRNSPSHEKLDTVHSTAFAACSFVRPSGGVSCAVMSFV